MGNVLMMYCGVSEFQQLSFLALDICPVPSYAPNPLINDMLMSPNASLHLSDHYRDVQDSLSPSELAQFTRRLRATFGGEGKVTAVGVGVVALALAVLFDTLAKEVKGQRVPQSGPLPGLFLQEPGRTHLPPVLQVSEYLRLVPTIANNHARMREETEKCLDKLEEMRQTYLQNLESEGVSHVDVFNSVSVWKIALGLQQHHRLLSNSTSSGNLFYNSYLSPNKMGHSVSAFKSSFNCDLKAGNTAFKQEVLKSNEIREELKQCGIPIEEQTTEGAIPDIEFVFIALSVNMNDLEAWREGKLVAPGEDFDLKAKSHLPF